MATDEDFFGLTDADYFQRSAGRDPAPLNRTLNKNFRGVGIGLPRVVALDNRTALPMLACHVATLGEMRLRRFGRQAVVVVVDRRSGQVFVDMAAAVDEPALPPNIPAALLARDPDDGPPPDTSNDRGSLLRLIDLRSRLNLPWRSASYLVTVILMDTISNRVPVRLSTSESEYYDEEVEKFIQNEYARARPMPVFPPPGNPVPRYRSLPQSPAVPAQPGIAMVIDRVSVMRPGGRCSLFGSFRLPLMPRNIVRPDPNAHSVDVLRPWHDATAVVDITLVITGTARPTPIVLQLHVPSYDAIDLANPPAEITGHFIFDLLHTEGVPHDAQTYFAYAIAGDVLVGPVPFAFIEPEIVPTIRES